MAGGGITQSIKMALTTTAGYPKSTANFSSLTIASGSSGTSTISVQSFGLKGTVILTTSVSSAGIAATLNPTSISYSPGQIHTSTLTINAKTPGTYAVTVTATMRTISSSVSLTVNVP